MKTPEKIAEEHTWRMLDEDVRGREWIRNAITAAIEADRAQRTPQMRTVHIVFDGPPAHESGRFIETETPDGKGISLGRWVERPDGYWALEIEVAQ